LALISVEGEGFIKVNSLGFVEKSVICTVRRKDTIRRQLKLRSKENIERIGIIK
jgi:hypothetical protein